jgi:[acyl-carrier-protein] S-malonyltransferase
LPQAAAGLSLGEYSALVCSNSLSFAETLPLVRSRGKYMQEAYPEGKGGMAAILGLEKKDVEEICVRSSRVGFVEPANYNCPGQVVISGDKLGLKEACRIVRQEMGKHAVMLSVSAPFHCSLLKSIEGKMRDLLEGVIIKKASIPVVSNVSADYVTTPNEIKDALIKQVSHPVLWEDSMCKLLREGHDFFLEVGPGKVLSGFMKRISSSIKILQMDNFQEVAAFFGK